MKSPTSRLLSRRRITSTGCWEFTGSKRNKDGYGDFKVGGEREMTHRVAFRLYIGAIPPEFHVCHTCDNPACFNPEHLFLGTPADNAHDRDAKGRGNLPVGEEHHAAKLDEASVREIRTSSSSGPELSRRFGVTRQEIYHVRKRRCWRHVS